MSLESGGLQQSQFRIDVKHKYIIRALVGCQQIFAGGFHQEVSRSLPTRCVMSNGCQFARDFVDTKRCDAIVPAVAAVDESASWVNLDVGR